MQGLGWVTLLPREAVSRTGSFHLTSSEPSLNLRVELWSTLVSLCLQLTLEKRTYLHRDVWVRECSPTLLLNLPEEAFLCFDTIGDFCPVFSTLETLDNESTIRNRQKVLQFSRSFVLCRFVVVYLCIPLFNKYVCLRCTRKP